MGRGPGRMARALGGQDAQGLVGGGQAVSLVITGLVLTIERLTGGAG